MSDALRIERVDATRVRVEGPLGFTEAGAALERDAAWLGAAAPQAPLELDVGGVRRVDSATLALLLAWAARAARRGVRLRVTGAPPDLRALAHLCGAEPLLGIA